MELSIQERLKDLRVERGLTLEQLAKQTHLSKSALGSYEGDNFKEMCIRDRFSLVPFYASYSSLQRFLILKSVALGLMLIS